jgi:hypothetical protein
MRKISIPFILMLFTINVYAQIHFEKGYIIFKEGEKNECLIKNVDWKNNPSKIEYKLKENDEVKVATVKNILEFGVYGFSKYISRNVAIDRSSENLNKLSDKRVPQFSQEHLFLKTLIEAEASLYMYEDGELRRYFYSTPNNDIEQLVFKRYKVRGNKIGFNNQFRQQLLTELKCSKITTQMVERLNYKKKDLINVFNLYNNCHGKHFVNYEEKAKRKVFNVSIRPGFLNAKLSANSIQRSRNIDFDSELGFRIGAELGFILPYNKNKWEIVVEPTFRKFKTQKTIPSHTVTASFNSIELPIGLRHYVFINSENKVFLNAGIVLDFGQNAKIEYSNGTDLEINQSSNTSFGIGFRHKDTYSLELRYQVKKGLLNEYVFWGSDYKSISLILGYTIF